MHARRSRTGWRWRTTSRPAACRSRWVSAFGAEGDFAVSFDPPPTTTSSSSCFRHQSQGPISVSAMDPRKWSLHTAPRSSNAPPTQPHPVRGSVRAPAPAPHAPAPGARLLQEAARRARPPHEDPALCRRLLLVAGRLCRHRGRQPAGSCPVVGALPGAGGELWRERGAAVRCVCGAAAGCGGGGCGLVCFAGGGHREAARFAVAPWAPTHNTHIQTRTHQSPPHQPSPPSPQQTPTDPNTTHTNQTRPPPNAPQPTPTQHTPTPHRTNPPGQASPSPSSRSPGTSWAGRCCPPSWACWRAWRWGPACPGWPTRWG